MKLLSQLNKADLEGKKVLLRVDFNVAVKNNVVQETAKIKAHKEFIDFLMGCGARVVMITHISAKKGALESYGLIIDTIQDVLGRPVAFCKNILGSDRFDMLASHQLVMLENLRTTPAEEANDVDFARSLAEGFDLYVDDAFANVHRPHASMVAVTKFLPSYVGPLIVAETEALSKIIDSPSQGKVVVLGGAKIESKLLVIDNFLSKAEHVLVGGALANNFFKLQGKDIGKSLYDPEKMDAIKDIDISRISLPIDTVVSDDMILDIGPKSQEQFASMISKAKSVLWCGAMGMYETPEFSHGTTAIAQVVAKAPFSVIGGGDTITSARKLGLLDKFSYVSTGGGAMLEFLAGMKLPALKALGYYE